jgi:hypothetical protein
MAPELRLRYNGIDGVQGANDMTVTLDIPRAAEPGLADDAARTGLAVPDLIQKLIEERYAPIVPQDDWERLLWSGGIAIGAALTDEQLGREYIYEDRD